MQTAEYQDVRANTLRSLQGLDRSVGFTALSWPGAHQSTLTALTSASVGQLAFDRDSDELMYAMSDGKMHYLRAPPYVFAALGSTQTVSAHPTGATIQLVGVSGKAHLMRWDDTNYAALTPIDATGDLEVTVSVTFDTPATDCWGRVDLRSGDGAGQYRQNGTALKAGEATTVTYTARIRNPVSTEPFQGVSLFVTHSDSGALDVTAASMQIVCAGQGSAAATKASTIASVT